MDRIAKIIQKLEANRRNLLKEVDTQKDLVRMAEAATEGIKSKMIMANNASDQRYLQIKDRLKT